jgi:hypothetical protein
MGLFRRREPLHERLAREGGLASWEPAQETWAPRWMEVGVHGTARPRRWDAVVTAPLELAGDAVVFVALPNGTLLVEGDDDVPDGALTPLAEAIEETLPPPYRAEAVRRGGAVWAGAASAIEVVELPPGTSGDEIVLSVSDGERTLKVDDFPSFGSVPALEQLGASRHEAYVVHATHLDGDLWEVAVSAL